MFAFDAPRPLSLAVAKIERDIAAIDDDPDSDLTGLSVTPSESTSRSPR